MFSCLQILEAFLWFVLITLLNVTLIILTLSVSRLLNLLLRLVAFLLFLNPQCLASISRWITASSSWKRFCLFVCRALSSIMVICMLTAIRLLLTLDRKSGSAGMPRPISYAVFCLKKKTTNTSKPYPAHALTAIICNLTTTHLAPAHKPSRDETDRSITATRSYARATVLHQRLLDRH